MKIIKLTHGQQAIIDDADLEAVSKLKWYAARSGNRFYARAYQQETGKEITLQKFIMHPGEGMSIFFKDGNSMNCSRSNIMVGCASDVLGTGKIKRRPNVEDDTVWRQFAAAALAGFCSNDGTMSIKAAAISASTAADELMAIRKQMLDRRFQDSQS